MTRVTLCVDALEPQPGGIGRYTWELAKGLGARSDVSASFYGRGRLIDDPGMLIRGEPLPPRRGRIRAWRDRRALRNSLVHGPNYFLPAFAESGIITVHDLSVFRFPETHPAARVRAFERDFRDSLSRAVHVITDTEAVRRELIETFSLRAETVSSVPLGVDPGYRPIPATALAGPLARWDLKPGGYGLFVSTLEPRKRVSELLAAWRALPRALRDSYPLVLCGGAGWRNEGLLEEVRQAVAEGWARHLGFVDEILLPQLYAGAALFVYPSIYEGFGLPPVEAMASGVPLMVSRHSCLPEVCGDAPHYFDPDDGDAFRLGLEQSLTDAAWRRQSSALGVERARRYRWDRCIDATVGIYQQVAASDKTDSVA